MDNHPPEKKSYSFYNKHGARYSLQWDFCDRSKWKSKEMRPSLKCPRCETHVLLKCSYCNHCALHLNPFNRSELICKKCEHITSSIYCHCGFKFTTPYLQKKLKSVKQVLRDGDRREYLAIAVTVLVYMALVWGIVSLGSLLNYPYG